MSDVAPETPEVSQARVPTGCSGLDDVLGGGFTPYRVYLLEGVPGAGKTTLALQYLLDGVRRGERVLYVTLSETADELRATAASHGWSLDGIEVREVLPTEASLDPDEQYTMFHPSEMELSATTQSILADVERIRPSRAVFDSLSEIRLLAANPLRYRRQILGLKQFFAGRHCTVLLLDDRTDTERNLQVHSIVHGVIQLQQLYPEYGNERRRLQVIKFRGATFRSGYHDYLMRKGGLVVFPRLVAAEHRGAVVRDKLPSGIAEFDALFGGGVERGTSTLIVGGAGTGKSSLAAQFVATAAERGHRAAMFSFDENVETLLTRADGLGIGLRRHVESGRALLQQVDPAELSPGELIDTIRREVVEHDTALIVVDSLNGYLNAMPGERHLVIQLHELLSYLGQAGAATILIGAHHGLVGGPMIAPVDASYLADAVVLLRFFEARGEVRQAISIVKKRGGNHERTIREFRLQAGGGIRVGAPLREFRGVLTGVPVLDGGPDLLGDNA